MSSNTNYISPSPAGEGWGGVWIRVTSLRQWMREHDLQAFVIPSTDPHNGEYVPDYWKCREWISGFNGSAGTAVVTLNDAALWTDSRYFLAAAEQLDGTPFRLMKDKLPETPSIGQWLRDQLPADARIGYHAPVCPQSFLEATQLSTLADRLTPTDDPMADIWSDRPALPLNPIEVQPLELAGESAASKLNRLRVHLGDKAAEPAVPCGSAAGSPALLIRELDNIAWLLNLRGTDVHCTPVFVSYLLVTPTSATLFVDDRKLTDPVRLHLAEADVSTAPYAQFSILNSQFSIVESDSSVSTMKAVKNETEIAGYRSAMRKDGVAMVKFLRWLKPAVEAGGQTEMSIDRKLTALRAEQPLFRDLSFDTIAGYAAHGAIVHYEATPETDATLEPRGLLLLDSGAQYQDGTTDITRTIALGPTTAEERRDYTLVLKGHIRLAMAKFPTGTSGTQLDVLARYAMWQECKNYLHGTGHGVGSYLSVHEGPHQFRMNWMPAPLQAGMTVTNEPGIYIAGSHGVRTENTMLITPYGEGEFGQFLQLEPLTLCPIDTAPIERDLMTEDEIQYLNDYHQLVFRELSPLLDGDDLEWLREATKPF